MRTMNEDEIYHEAAFWLRAQSGDGMDWDAFTTWLEADPRHRIAFDDMALIDERIDGLREEILGRHPANDTDEEEPPKRTRAWAWGGSVVAAGMLVAIASTWYSRPLDRPHTYAAAPGAARKVELASGLTATVSGGSRLTVNGPGQFALDGTAFFDIRHDPSRAILLNVAGYEIRDIGTQFDVTSDGVSVRVAVTRGAVSVLARGAANPIRVDAGYAAMGGADGRVSVFQTNASAIGAWRAGRFVYDRVPLSLVAADISRYTGQKVLASGLAGATPFSGVLAPGSRDAMVESLHRLTGVGARKEGDAILLGVDPGR